jgi:ubiquinone/menaquinone biosynthesis C-methylase UbiE
MSLQKDPENIEGKILQRLADFSNARVLEVGCGEGRLTFKYADSAKQVIAFDPDHDALRVAKADAKLKAGSQGEPCATFTEASASYIPFSKETFDIAVLAWSL